MSDPQVPLAQGPQQIEETLPRALCCLMPSLVGEALPAVDPRSHENPSGAQVAWPSHLEKEPEETDPPTQTSVAADRGSNYTTREGEERQAQHPRTLQVTGSSSWPKAS